MESLSLLIYILFVFSGLFFRKNSCIKWLILVYMWILIGLNTFTPDYAVYEAVFYGDNSTYATNMEPGFVGIMALLRNIGFSYQQFRMIWALVYVLLTFNFVRLNSDNCNYVLALMLICPTVLDISGIRSAVAYLVVFNFVLFLRKPTLKNRIIYCAGVLLASTIHSSALFYIIFIWSGKELTQKIKRIVILLISFGTIIVYSPLFDIVVSKVYDITGLRIVRKWAMGGIDVAKPNLVGIMSVAIFLIALVILSKYEVKVASEHLFADNCRIECNKVVDTVVFLNSIGFYMLFLLPVIAISLESRRLLYGALLVFHTVSSNVFSINDTAAKYTKKSFCCFAAQIIITTGILWIYIYTYQSHDVFAALKDNLLFSGFFCK